MTSAGFRHIWRTPPLRQLMLALILMVAVLGFLDNYFFAVVTGGLHRPAAFVGVLLSIQGLGAIAGGHSAAPFMRRVGEARLTSGGMLAGSPLDSMVCVAPGISSGPCRWRW